MYYIIVIIITIANSKAVLMRKALSNLCILTHANFHTNHGRQVHPTYPYLQTSKLRYREIKEVVQSCMANKQHSWNLNPDSVAQSLSP